MVIKQRETRIFLFVSNIYILAVVLLYTYTYTRKALLQIFSLSYSEISFIRCFGIRQFLLSELFGKYLGHLLTLFELQNLSNLE